MKQFSRFTLLVLATFALFFSSCVPLKDFVYIQGQSAEEDIEVAEIKAYKIQPNDNLYIQVISNDELSTYFNLSTKDQYLNTAAAIELSSFKVDLEGFIDFPYAGKIKVSGLTTEEISQLLKDYVAQKLIEYSIVVKLVNRSVSLVGEFQSPGVYSFYRDRLTIFEAIGLGRDLTDLANRHNVKVIRHVDNKKQVAVLDLTKPEILTSEYYYIMPNDIIYVEPSHKFYESKALSITTTVVGGFSTLFNIYYILDRTLIPGGAAEQ